MKLWFGTVRSGEGRGGSNLRSGAILATMAGAAALALSTVPGAHAQVDGGAVFNSNGCAACHGANGEGGIGPALAGNAALGDVNHVVDQILHGGGPMPPFAQLSDDDIAAVATYIRTSWGNAFEAVTAADVAARRAAAPA